MPQYKELLILANKRCHIRKHTNREGYEIRLRSDGYNVSASGRTKELAKKAFLEKIKSGKAEKATVVPSTFTAFALFYVENFRKGVISDKTLKSDSYRFNAYLKPYFKEKPLAKIQPIDCKRLLDDIYSKGYNKTADEIYSQMNCIFKNAIAHGLINRNPLATVQHFSHERKSGTVLSYDEQITLLKSVNGLSLPFQQAILIMLFCGLRPNELYKIKEYSTPFLVAENSKRHSKKIEYKTIYTIKTLRSFLDAGLSKIPKPQQVRIIFQKILPNHTLKDLRKTFNTRCKELGVSEHARMHFIGHSLGALEETYTELSIDYLKTEGEKLEKWCEMFPNCSPNLKSRKIKGGKKV